MLCLQYQDEHERTGAVASIAERCRQLDARLVFLGSEKACETTRRELSQFESTARSCLTIRPLPFGENGSDAELSWVEAIEVIRAALTEVFTLGGATVAWVEAPLIKSRVATAKAVFAYHDTLETIAAGSLTTVISACRLGHMAEGALLVALTEGSIVLISAKLVLPHCPSWLISRTRTDFTSVVGIPTSPGSPAPPTSADSVFTPFCQAEKLAALGQLAAGIAHELGNPLCIINSSLQYLHRRLAAANDSASDFTMTALQSVERMHGLLRSMLDFSAVKQPHFEQMDLQEAVSEIVRFTSAECARCGITVDVSFDPALTLAWADPGGVKQVLLNLIKNALDALLQGGGALRIRTRLCTEDRLATIEVENNGPPISTDALPNLFRPFHTTKDGGTGLGLYLSRQIAQDHGGDLEAKNLPNGVRFTLALPLDRRMGDGRQPWRTS